MSGQELSLWDKLDPELATAKHSRQEQGGATSEIFEVNRRRWRRLRPFVDAFATVLWAYVLLKIFVSDVDEQLLGWVAPEFSWVIEYRFFVFAGLLAVLVLFWHRRAIPILIYVACFPLVVVVWKLPKTLYRLKSWVAFFAVANVFASIVTSFRYLVVAGATALLACLAILISNQAFVLAVAATVIAILLGWSFFRTIRYSLSTSRFLKMQEVAIRRVLDSPAAGTMLEVSEDLRRADIEVFNEAQQNQFLGNLSYGVIAHRGIYFWAFQLDRYRQSAASFLLSSGSYIVLLVQAVAGLTLINYAIYKVDAEAYTFDTAPSLVVFARYSFTAMTAGEIDAVQAHSTMANIVAITSIFVGVVLLFGLVLTWVVSYRQARHEAAIQATIGNIKAEGRKLEARFYDEYKVSIDEAIGRLKEFHWALVGIITFLSARIPEGFESDEQLID